MRTSHGQVGFRGRSLAHSSSAWQSDMTYDTELLNLLASENQLRLANNKAEDLTINKLTKNSPSLKEQFKHLK